VQYDQSGCKWSLLVQVTVSKAFSHNQYFIIMLGRQFEDDGTFGIDSFCFAGIRQAGLAAELTMLYSDSSHRLRHRRIIEYP
jgi:hypothetical protein